MIHWTPLRAMLGAAVTLVAIQMLGQVLLSLSWLTTVSWVIAWTIAIALGGAVYFGLRRRPGQDLR